VKLSARFVCLSGCPGEWPVTKVMYSCPSCGGLLQVEHDLTALRGSSGTEWRKLFDQRYKGTRWPYGSGVWGKREWVMPNIDDDLIVSMDEGGTNLFWAERYGKQIGVDDLWVKLCGNSHSGSFKDLGMTVLVSVVRQAVREGLKVKAVACASTGDTSASLAAYGAAAGLPVVVLLPRGKITTGQLVQPLAHGALVLGLDTDFDGCMEIVRRLAEEQIVAIEIVQQFDWEVPDWVILPSGNLGNAAALYAGFQMMIDLGVANRLPRLVVAQAAAANPLYRAWSAGKREVEPMRAETTLASAIQIGNPVSAPRAFRALDAMNGIVEQATEQELVDAAAEADATGMYTCPHTAVGLAVLKKLVRAGTIQKSERVVCISTAHGLKFTEFKVRYHESALGGIESPRANPAVMLPPDFDQVTRAIQQRFA
jgi:threonine synthase